MKAMDVWGNVLSTAVKLPVINVDRNEFLRKELAPYCSEEQIRTAIFDSPCKVLNHHQISRIANGCIKYHLTLVCGTSALAGIPGGWAMLGTIPTDIAQFYGHILALVQKLHYIYGGPMLLNGANDLNSETKQLLTLYVGAMFGVTQAQRVLNSVLAKMGQELAESLIKSIMTSPATSAIVKEVGKIIGVKLTEKSASRIASKAFPLIGAPISAGLTYWTFKPMANRLKKMFDEQYQLQSRDKWEKDKLPYIIEA